MPWVRFDANTGTTRMETEEEVYLRGAKCIEEFTEKKENLEKIVRNDTP